MPPKKSIKAFPAECCGVCSFAHVPESREKDELMCWVDAPVTAAETDDNGTIGSVWIRGAFVAPEMPACRHFKPRLHA